jgi:glycosyltransferase involved in cell wall biosynthesis
MIKIVHVITGLGIGGAEMMLYKILSGSDRQRFSHSVISMLDEGSIGKKIKALGIPVYTLGMKRSIPSPASILRLTIMVRSIQPNIIQGWMYHGNLLSLIASKPIKRRIPVIWNVRQSLYSLSHEKPMTRMVIRCGALLSRYATRIFYNSSTGAGHHEKIGFNSKKSIIIPNGFDSDVFAPSEVARCSVRKELGLDADTLLIGLIARYAAMKDHRTFLKAAALLHKKHPEVHFLLVGSDVTPQNEFLMSLINEGGLVDNIHLLGERHDIPQLTAALDCAALSSFAEGFPNVVGEAMSCGVPCVVTDVGDTAWLVDDTGIVVPPREPEALARAMEGLVEMETEERKSLGKRARQRIVEHFSLHLALGKYEQLYVDLASKLSSTARPKPQI